MDELDIKVAVLEWVRSACRGRTLPVVTSEFTLAPSGVRADLAFLDDAFIGVEIKSAQDSLKRLPSQMRAYGCFFDKSILVTAKRHLPALKPSNLAGSAVWVISDEGELAPLRMGARPYQYGLELLDLLTQEERRRADRELRNHQLQGALGPVQYEFEAARQAFEKAFRLRYNETSTAFWRKVRRRAIRRDDLKLLSRFHAAREEMQRAVTDKADRWARWVAAMQANASAY